jgi:predicted NACHT family NTPase
VQRAIGRHTTALASANIRTDNTFLTSYHRHIRDAHGKLRPPNVVRRLVPIEDIYVPARILENSPTERRLASPREEPAPLTVDDLAERLDRTVLLGDPGGGKTTTAKVLMNRSDRVPFLVTLREYAASDPPERSIVDHIAHDLWTFYQCPAPDGPIDRLLLSGRAVVIFDGLDELLDTTHRADVTARVEQFCTEYPLARVLVTSRVIGYDEARLDDGRFTTYRLGGFSDGDVRAYVDKWFAQQEDGRLGDAEAFLAESTSVPDLRSNPLLLALMCILFEGQGSLPRDRAGIYEACAKLLFRGWDESRRIRAGLRVGRHLYPTLSHLAWRLFSDATATSVTERELITRTAEYLHDRAFESLDDARDVASEFVEFCRGRMWVFTEVGTTARGEKLYAFTHRTFLEYFAAEQLAHVLAPQIARNEWEVVSELAVQIKADNTNGGADRMYRALLDGQRRPYPSVDRSITIDRPRLDA